MNDFTYTLVHRMCEYANSLHACVIEQCRTGNIDRNFVKYAKTIAEANYKYIDSLIAAENKERLNILNSELDAKNTAAVEKIASDVVEEFATAIASCIPGATEMK